MFRFTDYNSTDRSMYAILAEENANVKDTVDIYILLKFLRGKSRKNFSWSLNYVAREIPLRGKSRKFEKFHLKQL